MNKFEDERGIIEDLKVGKDWSVTYISFKKGAVRGNHYHKETKQTDYILSGSFICSKKYSFSSVIPAGKLKFVRVKLLFTIQTKYTRTRRWKMERSFPCAKGYGLERTTKKTRSVFRTKKNLYDNVPS